MNTKNLFILCFVTGQALCANQLPEYALNHECTSDKGVKARYQAYQMSLNSYLWFLEQLCERNFAITSEFRISFCEKIKSLKRDLNFADEWTDLKVQKRFLDDIKCINNQIFNCLSAEQYSENRNMKEIYWAVHEKLKSFQDCLVIKQFYQTLQQNQK